MMRHGWRCFVALTHMELLRLLRTREVWTRMLAPALAFPIAMVAMAIGIVVVVEHLDDGRVVAFGPDTPAELNVQAEFEAAGWQVVFVSDPRAAVRRGDADLGVGPWLRGAGIGESVDHRLAPMNEDFERVGQLPGDSYLWTVHVWDSADTEDERIHPFYDIEEAAFEAALAMRGRSADGMSWPLSFQHLVLDDPGSTSVDAFPGLPDIYGHQVRTVDFMQLFATVMAAALGLQMLALSPVSDRTEGIFETLATSAAPTHAILAARAVAGGGFLWLATSLVSLPISGFMLRMESPESSLADVVLWMTAAVVFVTACYLPIGALSRSIQDANTLGAYAGGLAMVGGTGMVFLPAPSALVASFALLVLIVLFLGRSGVLARPPKADTP